MKKYIFLFCAALIGCVSNSQSQSITESIKNSKPVVVLTDGSISTNIKVDRKWIGNNCKISITNNGSSTLQIKEVVLFSADKLFAESTPIYAEGFELLSQTGGTLAHPKNIGYFNENKFYKLTEPPGYKVVYNLLHLSSSDNNQYLLGFSSANRFVGKFYLSADIVKVVMDIENLEMPAGAT